MNVQKFLAAFEEMRSHNLGKQFERRELGLLAIQYGIYFNSTMWASGLSLLFHVGNLGPKYVYSFKNTVTTPAQITILSNRIRAYKNDNNRTIEHAKNILRRFGIHNID